MFYNCREKSIELQILEELQLRMELSKEDEQRLLHLQKGYEGEVLFDQHLEGVISECLILRNLIFNINGSTIQIDTLPILDNTIYLFEVKNFDGNYFLDNEKMYKLPNYEITNPLHQLERSQIYFKQLLKNLDSNLKLKSYVVFVNPTFTLYQAPLNKPMIFPTQIDSLLQRLNSHTGKLNSRHKMLADKLLSLCVEDRPIKDLPAYNFHTLRKGIICKSCRSFYGSVRGKSCVCANCGMYEKVDEAVLRNIRSFQLLFPEEKLTRKVIQDWCGIIASRKMISRILEQNFQKVNKNRWVYFV